jgi:transcriptional regulator with XRE-family HTH domain
MKTDFGALVRKYRERAGLTLYDMQREHGTDPSHLSKLERGALPPFQDPERVEHLADWVGVPERDADRERFRDAAKLSRGELPEDVAEQEGAEVYLLPAIRRARAARRREVA